MSNEPALTPAELTAGELIVSASDLAEMAVQPITPTSLFAIERAVHQLAMIVAELRTTVGQPQDRLA